ncbi:2-polyprenyl-6-methoxyphenol hydroxylase-like FAD-dependent oxidoreductase [Bradyrhizobium sp. JR6.1]
MSLANPGHGPMYDVAIVGLGPVGAIFANLLAKAGLSVAVVERTAAIYDKPRAITLDHEALRVLQAIGLADFMEQAIAPHNGSHYLGVDGEIIKIFDPYAAAVSARLDSERDVRAA